MSKLAERMKSRGEGAADAFQEADCLDALPRVNFGDDVVFRLDAKTARNGGTAPSQSNARAARTRSAGYFIGRNRS